MCCCGHLRVILEHKLIFTFGLLQTAAILIPAFQQLNGINSITFYAPQLFASIGAGLTGTYGALLSSVVIDAIEMAGNLLGLGTVDR